MDILQLRATVFLSQNIGYNPDTAKSFSEIIGLDDCKIQGLPLPGISNNSTEPQWNMPWTIITKNDNYMYNINFLPGKIDIVEAVENIYDKNIENTFVNNCVLWFNKICDKIQGKPSRLAYAPLYMISDGLQNLWGSILKENSLDGLSANDKNVSFNYKKEIVIGEKNCEVNLLHNFYDGVKTYSENNIRKSKIVVGIQLDLNTIPMKNYEFSDDETRLFFDEITKINEQLIKRILS